MNPRAFAATLIAAGLSVGLARAAEASAAAPATREALVLTAAGGDGYLVRAGGRTVLVDGFPGGAAAREAGLRRSLAERVAARPPFADVAVALVRRATPASFDPDLAGRFLESHPRTKLAATPVVAAEIAARFARADAIRPQIVAVAWDARGRTSRTLNGVTVDFFRLAPDPADPEGDDVVVQVVHLGRRAVLDAADPALTPRQLGRLRLRREGLDLAVMSYAFLVAPGADSVLARRVHARRLAVAGLPAGSAPALARVRRRFPGAFALQAPPPALAP